MISRFINKFRKADGDEQRAFQRRVLGVLRELYPDRDFDLDNDPLSLTSGGSKLGLTNIRASFLLTAQTDRDLKTLVAEHFGGIWSGLGLEDRDKMVWEETRKQILPQLMPEDFLNKLDLSSFEFGGGIVIGMVIDSEKAYSYVTSDDLRRWNVDKLEVYAAAIDNLDDRTRDIAATVIPGQNGMIVVNTMDSFDAARILLPRLQAKFAELIGSPFNFGVPNRDFLICWSRAGDEEFQKSMRAQLVQDCEERPYPLSPCTFESGINGRIRQLADPEPNASPQNAEFN